MIDMGVRRQKESKEGACGIVAINLYYFFNETKLKIELLPFVYSEYLTDFRLSSATLNCEGISIVSHNIRSSAPAVLLQLQ